MILSPHSFDKFCRLKIYTHACRMGTDFCGISRFCFLERDALVVPPFSWSKNERYNGGFFFVKPESILEISVGRDNQDKCVSI